MAMIAAELGSEESQFLFLTEIETFASCALVQQRTQIYASRGNGLLCQNLQQQPTNLYHDADDLACGEIQG